MCLVKFIIYLIAFTFLRLRNQKKMFWTWNCLFISIYAKDQTRGKTQQFEESELIVKNIKFHFVYNT